MSPVTIVAIRCTTDFNPGDNSAYELAPRLPATESESAADHAGTAVWMPPPGRLSVAQLRARCQVS